MRVFARLWVKIEGCHFVDWDILVRDCLEESVVLHPDTVLLIWKHRLKENSNWVLFSKRMAHGTERGLQDIRLDQAESRTVHERHVHLGWSFNMLWGPQTWDTHSSLLFNWHIKLEKNACALLTVQMPQLHHVHCACHCSVLLSCHHQLAYHCLPRHMHSTYCIVWVLKIEVINMC